MNKNPQRKVMINNQRRGTILLKNILKLSKHKFSDQYFCMKILKKIDLLEQKTVEHLSNE